MTFNKSTQFPGDGALSFLLELQAALVVFLTLVAFPISLAASTFAPPGEPMPSANPPKPKQDLNSIKRPLEVFNDRPSNDPTVIYFDKGKPKYRIPRNYIVNRGNWNNDATNIFLSLKVTFPGFKPLTEETRDCLTRPPLYWPKGCMPIQFWTVVNAHSSEKPYVLTDEQKFKNASKLFRSQTPKPGPDGFEMFETGQDNVYIESYHKKLTDRSIYISCILSDHNGKRDATCDDSFSPLPNGGGLSYRFHLNQMEHAEEIDTGLRNLLKSFTIPEDKP